MCFVGQLKSLNKHKIFNPYEYFSSQYLQR